MTTQEIKLRFGIIGNSPLLEHAIDIAKQVAPTDITVLITGESGVGKEIFPQIIHQLSARKHGPFIAVNCGAIPEGTIDSELFGHEKGSFTGAHEARKGYFEGVNGGTIFLDEVAELPHNTQVRLLRVLETGEFIKVGSSKAQKTNVRLVCATNVYIPDAIQQGKFREDLYYRLSTVPIQMPPLRQRSEDIHLLFKKFASDFADRYRMPPVELTPDAVRAMLSYTWPGNIRQLKNVTEQVSILEKNRVISLETIRKYLPDENISRLPVIVKGENKSNDFSERELLYKVLFDMKKDITEMKTIVGALVRHTGIENSDFDHLTHRNPDFEKLKLRSEVPMSHSTALTVPVQPTPPLNPTPLPASQIAHRDSISATSTSIGHVEHKLKEAEPFEEHQEVEESLSLQVREEEWIKRALAKHKGRRKRAAQELGISERTLYRKIKEYNIEE